MAVIYSRDVLIENEDSNLTTQITMTGSPVVGPNISSINGFLVTNNPSNTATVWVFGSTSGSSNGYPILNDGRVILLSITNLNLASFQGTAGNKVCAIKA